MCSYSYSPHYCCSILIGRVSQSRLAFPNAGPLLVGNTDRIYDCKFSFPRILFFGDTVPNV